MRLSNEILNNFPLCLAASALLHKIKEQKKTKREIEREVGGGRKTVREKNEVKLK